jgi:hypothetical protein
MWSLEYSFEAGRDFELIFDHLFAAYCDLSDHPDEALERGRALAWGAAEHGINLIHRPVARRILARTSSGSSAQ